MGAGLVVAALWSAVVGAAPQPPTSDATAKPTATSDHQSATIGTMVRVNGAGWGATGSGVVKVQVCGNGGVNRSPDCDLAGTASGAIRDGGTFFTAITVSRPPKPCPCVLRVTSSVTPYEIRIPIEIPGLPTAPVTALTATTRALKITKVSVRSDDSWTAWFGAAPQRTLQFTLANSGNVTLTDPAIDLAFGRGDAPSGFMAAPSVGALAPGERRVVRAAVPLTAGAVGTYRVTIDADPIGGITAHKSTTTSTYPWGLFVIALVVLQVVLVRLRNRLRRRTEAAAAAAEAADAADAEGTPAELAEVAPASAAALGEPTPEGEPDPETQPVSEPDPSGTAVHPEEPQSSDAPLSADAVAADEQEPVGLAPGGRPVRPHRMPMLLLLALTGVLALAGCSSSSGGDSSGPTTTTKPASSLAKGCALHQSDAEKVLGPGVKAVSPPPLAGVAAPVSRCAFSAKGATFQLTVFDGPEMAASVASSLFGSGGKSAPELGGGGACASGKGTTMATASCLFVQDGRSYILGLTMPVKDLTSATPAKVRKVAASVSGRLPGKPGAAATTTTASKATTSTTKP